MKIAKRLNRKQPNEFNTLIYKYLQTVLSSTAA